MGERLSLNVRLLNWGGRIIKKKRAVFRPLLVNSLKNMKPLYLNDHHLLITNTFGLKTFKIEQLLKSTKVISTIKYLVVF
jgi:hypothetical protein